LKKTRAARLCDPQPASHEVFPAEFRAGFNFGISYFAGIVSNWPDASS